MFDAGNVGLPEATIVAVMVCVVLLAWKVNQ